MFAFSFEIYDFAITQPHVENFPHLFDLLSYSAFILFIYKCPLILLNSKKTKSKISLIICPGYSLISSNKDIK